MIKISLFFSFLFVVLCQAPVSFADQALDLNAARLSEMQVLGGEWPIPLRLEEVSLKELQGNWQVVGSRMILTIEEEKWNWLGLTVANVSLTSLDEKKIVATGFGFIVEGSLRGVISLGNHQWQFFSVGRGFHRLTGEMVYYLLQGPKPEELEFHKLLP